MKRPILNKHERFYLKYLPNSKYARFLHLFLARKRFLRALQYTLLGNNKKQLKTKI